MPIRYHIPSHSEVTDMVGQVYRILQELNDHVPDNKKNDVKQALGKLSEIQAYLGQLGIIES